ncbi:co-chaperone GroES [Candidatus Falkowbacteria bacterium RIFOXYD2_FULL_35_9]|uniref:Co-chaperonin GroES n=1 Tax=Candidatus Falkowbacteria bacterium RIFOXYC2_FULL_36_12 TaxID=1798002 RepID=A0A1F5T3S7_9BACT|nr:MAG: co-chaperone GroES [Candidatus Falkowbacteria bacterium RIFOXYC2_FULL_36_12]OGF33953.1 MAG: co-chaperone GroES [Candidatus Falkowbacteria bacterium RIFOXYA2_FULL_35_8]OGF46067.1 MAG: co-chaperone GroES [Candidatus Falkowbacteria bacterium RIFOXYD2_FULL_35_9]
MLKPLNDNVVVKPLTSEETTASGIIIPDTASKEKPEQGEIIAVGPGKISESGVRVQMSVQVGQKIVFTKYSPNEIKIGTENYLVLKEEDILAIVE